MEDNKKEYKPSPVLGPLQDGDDKEMYMLFSFLLDIYNRGFIDPLINFVKSEGRILLFLMNSDGVCHPSDISDGLNLSRPNVAANLRNMEKAGYITRETDKLNRRQVYVKITPAGIDCYQEETEAIVKMASMWFQMIGEEERIHLLSILQKTVEGTKDLKLKPADKKKDDNVWKLI